ncbi:MAG: DUF4388 domain-containing protein, partial [Acidobacteriota bacterium]
MSSTRGPEPLQGSLREKAVLPLLLELQQGRATGFLKLERAPFQKTIVLRDGQILFAASNDPQDQLASILVAQGKLSRETLKQAQGLASKGDPLARVLAEQGWVTADELLDAARLKVEGILADLYGWKEGRYEFEEGALPKGRVSLKLSTPRLLFNSLTRMNGTGWAPAELGSLEAVLSPGLSWEAFLEETRPEEGVGEILRRVDGSRTVGEIAALSSSGELEVCKILAAALRLGVLTKKVAEGAQDKEVAGPTPRDGERQLSGGIEAAGSSSIDQAFTLADGQRKPALVFSETQGALPSPRAAAPEFLILDPPHKSARPTSRPRSSRRR